MGECVGSTVSQRHERGGGGQEADGVDSGSGDGNKIHGTERTNEPREPKGDLRAEENMPPRKGTLGRQ